MRMGFLRFIRTLYDHFFQFIHKSFWYIIFMLQGVFNGLTNSLHWIKEKKERNIHEFKIHIVFRVIFF